MVKHTQTIRRLMSTNCLSVFDHFVGLALKELICKAHRFTSFYVKGTYVINMSNSYHLLECVKSNSKAISFLSLFCVSFLCFVKVNLSPRVFEKVWRCSCVFIANFGHISLIFSLYSTIWLDYRQKIHRTTGTRNQ